MRDSHLNCVANVKLPLHGRYSTEVACRWQRMPDSGSNVSKYSRQRPQEGHFAGHWHIAADKGDGTPELCARVSYTGQPVSCLSYCQHGLSKALRHQLFTELTCSTKIE
jgi:hypothetical protein